MAKEVTCGEGGSTGTEWAKRINTLSQHRPNASVRLNGNTPIIQTFTDDIEPIPMKFANLVIIERNGFNASIDANDIPILVNTGVPSLLEFNASGDIPLAELSVGINAEIDGVGDSLEIYLYTSTDGGTVWTPTSESPFILQGMGTGKPASIYWLAQLPIQGGEMFQLRGRNADAGSFDCIFRRGNMRLVCDISDILPI